MHMVIIDNIVELTRLFTETALGNPLSALLMLVGTALIVFSVAVMGYLGLGALGDLIVPDTIGRAPPQE